MIRARIIPARAGFTRQWKRQMGGLEDHPRSRGVYASTSTTRAGARGSSPLARGLLITVAVNLLLMRIIPARAGFTPRPSSGGSPPGDHPRSRGVYVLNKTGSPEAVGSSPLARGLRAGSAWPGRSGRGSSPLARGLHRCYGERRRGVRIIPARAGFTGLLERRLHDLADHPRSRGVYLKTVDALVQTVGSSPLARGLPSPSLATRAPGGIIPARAGFTRCRGHPHRGREDHPRSRGVYSRPWRRWESAPGSSPLARGLLGSRRDPVADGRIIPARAGFTGGAQRRGGQVRDHPRSRGVYPQSAYTARRYCGSSPLARGLPRGWRPGRRAAGIIPARAGFTLEERDEILPGQDHPRSRGVYRTLRIDSARGGGSSPLARGLRSAPPTGGRPPRIIPARAGFTRGDGRVPARPPDHPRSRGVYGCTVVHRGGAPGSSPLARGLHEDPGTLAARGRIIPARAGFTTGG